MLQTTISLSNIEEFKQKALAWANYFQVFLLFDSNEYSQDSYSKFEWELFVDAVDFVAPEQHHFKVVEAFKNRSNEIVVGFFGYECKNDLFGFTGKEKSAGELPDCYFFRARYRFSIKGDKLTINRNYPEAFEMYERIMSLDMPKPNTNSAIDFQHQTSKEEYVKAVTHLRERIEEGDFYEINYCTEVKAKNVFVNPLAVYRSLMDKTQAPFSAFLKYQEQYVLCASPERFLCKRKNKLISQPIKGTIMRGNNAAEDEQKKSELLQSEKERAENVMIVDLVRNDLTPYAVPGSIKVEELFGVYAFKTVHQMISTLSCELKDEDDAMKAIANAFPMGSMTGAPKVEVMKKIEEIERMSRGLFSGTIGYLDTDGDFDFNVVIRTIFYDNKGKEISIKTGSAITYDSDPEAEYEELQLKRDALLKSLLH